ncbi:MAG: YCF48-related protein [bacterium]|nr:YCF48-related protein [bacterium]
MFLRINILSLLVLIAAASGSFGQAGWTGLSKPGNVDLVAVYFTSDRNGWVAGDAGYLAVTNDGGRNWSKVPLNLTEDINEIYFRNESDGYLVAGRKVFITRDGGRSWNETRIYGANEFRGMTPEFLSIRFADKKRGIAVGSLLRKVKNEDVVVDSLVMRTDDGGETWQRIQMPTKTELFHLDYNGSSHAWIVGDNGVVLASTDSGKTWVKQGSGTTNALFNVDFRDDDEGYAVGEGGTILRTENGGRSWTRVITNFTETLMRVDFADDKNGWIVGHKGSILRSSDKGRSWIKQESTTPNHLYGLFMSKRNGWAVGAKGVIVGYQR